MNRRYISLAIAAIVFFIWRGCGEKPDAAQPGGIYSIVIYKKGYGYLKVIETIPGKKYVRVVQSLFPKRPKDLQGYQPDSGKYFALLTGDWESLKPKLISVCF